jgi:photosystem II stability/assembly factor-like uncharacterized protein
MLFRYLKACVVCLLLAAPVQAIEKGETYDVLNLPAPLSSRATESNLYGIARAGSRLVAVGQRGIVLYSDDKGRSWSQGQVPVRSVLLDVFFANDNLGWAVGHDGVILHSADGGETWAKQLDGYQLNESGLAYYGGLARENPDNEAYAMVLGEFEFAAEQGADKPFLTVYFADEKRGFAMGAYGFSVATEDGGANWVPVMEHGPLAFRHVFDYEIVGDRFFLTQEMGYILTGQIGQRASVASIIPFYDGSFYTMTSSEQGDLLVAGLRAAAFRSDDGAQTWELLELPTSASINGSARLADGRIVLVSQNGELLVSDDDGRTFEVAPLKNTFPFSSVIETDPGQLVLVGLGGVLAVSLDQ